MLKFLWDHILLWIGIILIVFGNFLATDSGQHMLNGWLN